MRIDDKIGSRLTQLIEAGEKVLGTRRDPPRNVFGDASVDSQLAAQWVTTYIPLLANRLLTNFTFPERPENFNATNYS